MYIILYKRLRSVVKYVDSAKLYLKFEHPYAKENKQPKVYNDQSIKVLF